jgi:hypothetical protein
MESSPKNSKYLLNLISSYLTHEGRIVPQIFTIFIRVFQELIVLPYFWPPEVILTVFDVLGHLSLQVDPEDRSTGIAARDLILVLCSYTTSLLKIENLVPLQTRIVRAFDLICKWSLIGNWIMNDAPAQKCIVSCLARGVTILDRENAFSTLNEQIDILPSNPPILSQNIMQSLAKLSEAVRGEAITTLSSTASFSFGTNSPSAQRNKKNQSRISIAPPKRFAAKVRLSFQPSGGNQVSTGLKDGGIGLPTFALLSTDIQIKTAAECALSLFNLRLSNYPPDGSCFGSSCLNSKWNESKRAQELMSLQHQLIDPNEPNLKTIEDCRFIHYFAYQKRIIFGITEHPNWSETNPESLVPQTILVCRDATGKFTWFGEFKYKDLIDHEIKTAPGGDLGSLQSVIEYAVDNSKVFEKWKTLVPSKTHFIPHELPKLPENTSITNSRGSNEDNIPSLLECANDLDKRIYDSIAASAAEHSCLDSVHLSQTEDKGGFHKAEPFPRIDTVDAHYL